MHRKANRPVLQHGNMYFGMCVMTTAQTMHDWSDTALLKKNKMD